MARIQDMAAQLKIGIIGGGYAGMAAAVELACHGHRVTVLESAKQLVGRARGVEYNGVMLDNGQHILLGCYKNTLGMIEKTGGNIAEDFQRLPLQLTIHKHFELKAAHLPAPLHLLAGFMNAKGLSWKSRFAAARFMLAMRSIKFNIIKDIPAIELLHQYNQDEALIRFLWEPVCISALNTPLAKSSAQVLLNVLRDSLNGSRADSEMLLPKLDFTSLFPQRAARFIEQHGSQVLLSHTVEAIIPEVNKITLETSHREFSFDKVICAASPASAVRLLQPFPQLQETAAQIAAIDYQPIYTVYLQYPENVKLPQVMLGLDRSISQWVFDKGQLAGQKGLLAVVISAEGHHQELTQEQLADQVIRELKDQLGILTSALWHKVIAEKRATFACVPNMQRPSTIPPIPNLMLAGDFTEGDYPATLEGAVISGINCANAIQLAFQA